MGSARGAAGVRGLLRHALAALSVLSVLVACEPKLVVGKWSCANADGNTGGGDASVEALSAPVDTPWSTGFENGFCDYGAVNGYCYVNGLASFQTVTSPVHSGNFAAAFDVRAGAGQVQTRCVRRGTLPSSAYYSAYFFIPSAPVATSNWNLMHFQGGERPPYHGLWDLSLTKDVDGGFHVYVYDFLRRLKRTTNGVPAVPIGSWFQLEIFIKRAADATGQVAVYQDGQLALRLDNLSTDDSTMGEWYLGNLAESLTPPENVLYVDDVAIREAP